MRRLVVRNSRGLRVIYKRVAHRRGSGDAGDRALLETQAFAHQRGRDGEAKGGVMVYNIPRGGKA